MKPDEIIEGGIYRGWTPIGWRRVVGFVVDHERPYVVYSIGRDDNRHCLLDTFRRWAYMRITVDEDGLVLPFVESVDPHASAV